jgi:hypothetical protein
VFLAALDITDPAARSAYLDEACAAAPDLRLRVEKLLAAHADATSFMDRPAPDRDPPGEQKRITIDKIYWHGSKEAPIQTRQAKGSSVPTGTGHLWLHGEEWWEDAGDYLQYKILLGRVDKHFVLREKGQEPVKCPLSGLYVTLHLQQLRDMEVLIPADEFAKMATGVAYTLYPMNAVADYRWEVKDGLTVTRPTTPEEKIGAPPERLDRLEKPVEALRRKPGPLWHTPLSPACLRARPPGRSSRTPAREQRKNASESERRGLLTRGYW